jgi:hypothetical protein
VSYQLRKNCLDWVALQRKHSYYQSLIPVITPFDSTKSSGRTNAASNSIVAAKDAGIACSC